MIAIALRIAPLIVMTGLIACTPVPYNPATNNDITPPNAALRVEGAGQDAVEVTNFVPGQLQNKHAVANPNATVKLLATASDNESGIKEITLKVTRSVKYIASNGSLVEMQAPTRVINSTRYSLNNGQAPSFGSIQVGVKPRDEFVFINANGNTVTGVGVVLAYTVEARNFNGQFSYTERLVVSSGQLQ